MIEGFHIDNDGWIERPIVHENEWTAYPSPRP
jgi:hypothetical protein